MVPPAGWVRVISRITIYYTWRKNACLGLREKVNVDCFNRAPKKSTVHWLDASAGRAGSKKTFTSPTTWATRCVRGWLPVAVDRVRRGPLRNGMVGRVLGCQVGEMLGPLALVKRLGRPPLMSETYSSGLPCIEEEKIICVPSGDHAGVILVP